MNKLVFALFYDLALFLLLLVSIPKILFERIRFGKYQGILKKKTGLGFDPIPLSKTPLVWIHAVSMGETKAIIGLATLLKKEYPHIRLLITSVTETGHAEAKRSLPFADYHLFLPFDFSFIVRPLVKKANPSLVILSETDYWYHFMSAAKDSGALTAIVNGKLSLRSLKRYKVLNRLFNGYFTPLDTLCVQSPRYAERFKALGILDSIIHVTGNLKLDAPKEILSNPDAFKKELGILETDRVLVAGSTHEGEEALVIETFLKLKKTQKNLKMLLVPRHPERFKTVAKLLQEKGHPDILLIDVMGRLKMCYQIAEIALVCGSFLPGVGGHNIIEPSIYGVPVLFGPYMHSQLDFVDLVETYGAGVKVSNENLFKELLELLENQEKRNLLKAGAIALTQSFEGSTQKTFELLQKEFHLNHILSLAGNEPDDVRSMHVN